MTEAGASSPHIQAEEQAQAAQLAAPRALVIHEIVREEGEVELARAPSALLLSGLAAGLSMGFSFLALALLRSGLPDAPWRHMVESFGYPVGFVIVVLGRQQLFTESTLTAVLPVLTRPTPGRFGALARLWLTVLAGNLAGTWLFATALTYPGLVAPEVRPALAEIGAETMRHSFGPTLLKAVFAGWLIALMVWLLPSARSARLWVIMLLTYVVSLAGLAHVIAGSSEAAYAVLTGDAAPADYLGVFLAPTLLGNIIGGVALVALLNHAPVAGELHGGSERN